MAKKRVTKKKGLGDKVKAVAKATGIDKAVEAVSNTLGIDCGCDERQAYLNTIGVKAKNCFEDKDFKVWGSLRSQLKGSIKSYQANVIIDTYLKLFEIDNSKVCRNCTGAAKVFNRMINQINKVYDSYGNS